VIRTLLYDFDGVVIDSMAIRESGFRRLFAEFPEQAVDRLLEFHRENAGLSRYVKIRYFFEQIQGVQISDEQVRQYADAFSEMMRRELSDPKYLIAETVDFIRGNQDRFDFHLVSGSDQQELRYLCGRLGISDAFVSIQGSPTPKIDLVAGLLSEFGCSRGETALVGDSMNDYDAAVANNISFFGFNNPGLADVGDRYIRDFASFSV
jgi:phosphoglycolate phosphatase-like HAD superfamily hydrolase